MNAIEIEEAVSTLASAPFDRGEFPYAFLMAFGNKETTIKRLRSGTSNKSDVGGVLQTNNLHIAVAQPGAVTHTLKVLKDSPATAKGKVRFIVATDGADFEAEDVATGETIACAFPDFPDHFGFFLPLAGISTVKQIRESSFDIRATSRLNRLYIELLNDNPEWGSEERRHEMNHFMARLIFCFFAEDTKIFSDSKLFSETIAQLSSRDSSDTNAVLAEIFRAMDTKMEDRSKSSFSRWASAFPYVNGGLFADAGVVPIISKISRSYLMHIGSLDWTKINPDIFGSMIQAVADDEERGALGMHYTSVPNILKVLNPLFLDELRERLEEAGDNPRMLLNLRKRLARIRVFDPACGSGNFLVIAYKQLRQIEHLINARRGEDGRPSDITITNFRGIEVRNFAAEIARLALVIAEYQCDHAYLGQQVAKDEFLPLDSANWITCANALEIDWFSICGSTGTGVKLISDDLFGTPLNQSEIDFEHEGGEIYICGNPPYIGSTWQSPEQKDDLRKIFAHRCANWKSLDYVSAWFMKAADYGKHTPCAAAFVTTNSICQGQQVAILWPLIFASGHEIAFAHTSFKWANLASHNAGVTVAIVGIANSAPKVRRIFSIADDGTTVVKEVSNINAYLAAGANVVVEKAVKPLCCQDEMSFGNKPVDGGNLLLTRDELESLGLSEQDSKRFIRPIVGSEEFIGGKLRFCIWIKDEDAQIAHMHSKIGPRLQLVKTMRLNSSKLATQRGAEWAHKFDERRQSGNETVIAVAAISSENRDYLPCGLLTRGTIISNKCFALYDAPLWNMALIASRLHWVWIGTVCVRMRTDFSYSNTLGWNTFPMPQLTDKNKDDLTRCAENILLAREAHFPATIADLYDLETMPANLREAHARNDEVLERIYIGRRFRNDSERLEKLFELYTKMTSKSPSKSKAGATV